MAQNICHLDQPSVVEHCIMSSPCRSISSCIKHAEKAAHGQATFTLQHPSGREEHISSLAAQVNSTEVGMHQPQKRFFWFFLIFALLAVVAIHFQILREEEFLRKQYGADYAEYHRRTARYLIW